MTETGKKIRCVLLALACGLLAGCGQSGAVSLRGGSSEADYSQAQIRLIAVTERNRYQSIYTDELWSAVASENGDTFETKLKEQIGQFLVELAAVNLMADGQSIELTSQEEDRLRTLAQTYYESLTEADLDCTGITQEEVYDLYCRCYRADKTVEELTGGEDLEVSDAEAKVIQVQRIRLESREEAEEVLAQVQEERADFGAIAARTSQESQTAFTLYWSAQMDALTAAAFALEQDQISGVIEQDGGFYIQKCTNAYDQEATEARKLVLARQKRTDTFRRFYEPFAAEHRVELGEGSLEAVDFSEGEESETADFFQVYREYFSVS